MKSIPRMAGLLAALALAAAAPAWAGDPAPIPPAIAGLARAVAAELMMQCPLSDADDVAAFASCRAGLHGDGVLRTQLPERVLWGRHGVHPLGTLRKTTLTQLRSDVWAQLYVPLFMFNGSHRVEWVPRENQFAIHLEAAFRNRLPAAAFPYPFWHDDAEWNAYQHANEVVLWVEPQSARIHVAQFTDHAATPLLQPVQAVARSFDGEWLVSAGADGSGTLFDGLYRADNPYLLPLDRHYRDFALQMQQAQCGQCHVPGNPAHARRLVLLATSAHAAAEVDRVIATVRSDRMADGTGHPHALPAEDREWLLQSAQGFREALGVAGQWETQAERSERRVTWLPLDPLRRLAAGREAHPSAAAAR